MPCPRCQHENPPESSFCLECGARLGLSCPACGSDLPDGAKFCNKCGGPIKAGQPASSRFTSPQAYTPKHLAEKILTSRSALEGERKQVTVLFADLKGSMELLADRDPEEARKLLDPVLERMMEAVHHYEGTVNQMMGDGIMAFRRVLVDGFRAFRTVTVTVRFANFVTTSRSHTAQVQLTTPEALDREVLPLLLPFLDARENPKRRLVRLTGVRAEKLVRESSSIAAQGPLALGNEVCLDPQDGAEEVRG